jgi:type IV pilus assembly protein PilX
MKMSHKMNTLPGSQRGVALFVGLMVLIVALLLGITATNSSIMQERMAGNFKDTSLAFQAAEAGSRWSTAWLQSRNSASQPFPCGSGCTSTSQVWSIGQYPAEPGPGDSLWGSDTAWTYGFDPTSTPEVAVDPVQSFGGVLDPMVFSQPKYIMEQQYFARDDLAGASFMGVAYYRVTSLGKGSRDSSAAIIKTLVAKRYQ